MDNIISIYCCYDSFSFQGKNRKNEMTFYNYCVYNIIYRDIDILLATILSIYIYMRSFITYYSFLRRITKTYPLFFFLPPLCRIRLCLFFFFYSLPLLLLLLLSRNNNNNNNNKRLNTFPPFCLILTLLSILPHIYRGCIYINNSYNMQCISKRYATHGCSL